MRLIWLLMFVFGLGCGAMANEHVDVKQESKIIPELIFNRFTSDDGLPDNRVRSFFQDSRGFLWLGTMNGLARYDGYTFKKFYITPEKTSISANWAYAICEDASRNLWIGTTSGLNFFDTKTEKFTRYLNVPSDKNSIFSNRITSLIFDKSGKLWIGTEDGLATYTPGSGKFTTLKGHPFNTNICKVIRSYGDYIWIATRHGVVHYNVKTDKYKYYASTIKPNIYGDTFWSLYEDDRNLYMGTTCSGLVKMPYNTQSGDYGALEYINSFSNTSERLTNDEIFDVCKSSSGDFWLATGRGLAKIENMGTNDARLSFHRNSPVNRKSLSNNTVYKVFIDKNNNLWCGTELGLNKLDLHLLPFHYYTFNDPLVQDQTRSIHTKDGENIWVGTSMNGAYKYNTAENSTVSYRFPPSLSRFNFNSNRSIFIDNTHNVWFGTLGGGIRFRAGSSQQSTEQFQGKGIYAYLQDSKGNMWVGTNNGLFRIKKDGTQEFYSDDLKGPNKVAGHFVRYLYEDQKGNIWIGFESAGLSCYLPDKDIFLAVSNFAGGGKLLGNTISSIVEYPNGVFWVGTDSGLNKINPKTDNRGRQVYAVRNYTEANGLSDKAVSGIIADDQGYLWISTIKGLLRFDVAKEQFHNFLPALNFTFSCAFKFSEKQFLFGTSDGFVAFDPHQISTTTLAPNAVISDLKLFNKDVQIDSIFNGDVILEQSIADTKEIILGHKNNVFTIGFTGLHFSNPGYNSYAYKMEGFDADWIYTGASNRSATYTNLDPGTYVFKVRASSSHGVWNQKPAELKIVVLNPPWKTWWAVLAYMILGSVLLYFVVRHLLIQARQKQKIDFDQKEIAQLKNLHNMKLEFFTDISHEFRTPLSLIVGPVEDMLAADTVASPTRQKLQMVYRNCKNLLYLIDELMTFQKLDQGMLKLALKKTNLVGFVHEICSNFEMLAERKSIDFRFACDLEEFNMWFDPGKMEMVLNNLIFNAFKFTESGGYIRVSIYTLPPTADDSKVWLCMAIDDNGKGIPKDEIEFIFDRFYQGATNKKGSGVGLSLSKSLIELHNGKITVESEPNINTRFTVFLPLLNIPVGQVNDVATTPARPIPHAERMPVTEEPAIETGDEKEELLIVDDNEEVLTFLEMLFKNKYRITKAQNGMEAIQCIRRQEPDLIISDVMMPKMNGIELCKIVKSQLATCHIPVILLTAKTTIENAIEGIGTGADDYVPKPFNADFLRLRVEKLIESQKRLIEKFQTGPGPMQENILLNPMEDVFLEKITKSIKDQINNEDFSVVELGSALGMSRSNLFRKLKAITGQTPIEFIYFIRLKYSVELLLERRLNISEIAYEVGFKNPSSFSKSFRKQFGKSPTTYLNDILAANKNTLEQVHENEGFENG